MMSAPCVTACTMPSTRASSVPTFAPSNTFIGMSDTPGGLENTCGGTGAAGTEWETPELMAGVNVDRFKREIQLAARLQQASLTPYFRPYTNPDIVGCELGGAVKNVIALACGIAEGLGFGDNTRASLITRGLAETARLGADDGP